MRSNPAKWIIPGILTVLVGTAVTVQATKAGMEADLSARSVAALDAATLNWAKVEFTARDASLGGTATNQADQQRALAIITSLHGVRSVTSAMDMAPVKSPYPFLARIENGKVSLRGGVPDMAVRDALMARSGATDESLELLAGLEDRASWLAATEFALRQLRQLDSGEVSLSDLTFSMSGRAKSLESYEAVNVIFNAGLPAGITRGTVAVTPPLQSPYEWHAVYDGSTVKLSGFVPGESLLETFGQQMPAGVALEPSLLLASGAPDKFETTTSSLLKAFAEVERGEARISDGKARFSGDPRSVAAVDALAKGLGTSGVELELSPPRIDDYVFVADRAGGKTRLSGYVPDQELLETLGKDGARDISGLAIGRGAPTGFDQVVAFGMAAMDELEAGQFAVENSAIVLSGNAENAESYEAVQRLVAQEAPAGMTLDTTELNSFVALPYVWAAERSAEGAYSFSGFVPAPQFQQELKQHTGEVVDDTSQIAAGAPDDFDKNAMAGLEALTKADAGQASYTGSEWMLTAEVSNETQKQAVLDALSASADASLWQISIEIAAEELPEPATTMIAPEAESAPVEAAEGDAPADTTTQSEPVAPESGTDALSVAESAADPAPAVELTPAADPAPVIEPTPAAETPTPAAEPVAEVTPEQPAAPAEVPLYRFSASKSSGADVRLLGAVPNDAVRRYLGVIAGKAPTDMLHLDEEAPDGFNDMAVAGVRALVTLDDGELLHERGQWSLTGTALNADMREQALAALADIAPWTTDIGMASPIALCRAHVEKLAADNTVLFNPGSARLTESSNDSIDQLATSLEECPMAIVHVEGHTDSDGDSGANLALSVARSEAVINELIARGVKADRLYAVGYGETLPIASNDTNDGKRRNRRIVFKILEDPE